MRLGFSDTVFHKRAILLIFESCAFMFLKGMLSNLGVYNSGTCHTGVPSLIDGALQFNVFCTKGTSASGSVKWMCTIRSHNEKIYITLSCSETVYCFSVISFKSYLRCRAPLGSQKRGAGAMHPDLP